MSAELKRILAAPLFSRDPEVLAGWLYENCYMREFGAPEEEEEEEEEYPDSSLAAELPAANQGRPRFDDGWRVDQMLAGGQVLARKHGALRSFAPGQFVARDGGPGSPPAPGDPIAVYAAVESVTVQPGMYFAFGETVSVDDEFTGLVRFYWNLRPDGAPALVRAITGEFNRLQVPFRLKCPLRAAAYARRDAAVLYVHRRYAHAASYVLARVYPQIRHHLRPSTPLFTQRLEDGFAFAEDPGGAGSFGRIRCRRLAEAMLAGRTVEDAVGEPASFPWPPALAPGPRAAVPRGFLDTAARIGARLCRDALWHGGQCNWTSDQQHGDELVHANLPAHVYGGTAGIALFLGRLDRATGESLFGATAQGAIAHAFAHIPQASAGLYTGAAGVLAAGAELGMEPAEAALRQHAEPRPDAFDLIAGAAGTVVALLGLGRVDLATRNGEWLVQHVAAWNAGLTGFSHGAAGIGWALAELFAATGSLLFAQCARAAFDYERTCYNAAERNWPDFRDGVTPRYPSLWCHGGPGIALSRWRAHAIFGDPSYLVEAAIGLDAAETAALQSGCLCHGRAGNADILLIGGRRDAAIRVCGSDAAADADTPELMTGLAGIGHFFLRLHDENIPSPLLWVPDNGRR